MNSQTIPLHIRLLSKLIPLLRWEDNLSQGEIEKFNFIDSCKNKFGWNKQVVGSRDGFELIWRHISDDYFKLVGKSIERRC